jgi:hypothetical protein
MVSTGYDGMFEFAAGRCGPRPFGKLRRRLSGFAAKEARKIARAHGDAIREGGYAEIVPRMPQNPGLKFADVWPGSSFPHIGAELGRQGKTTIIRATASVISRPRL